MLCSNSKMLEWIFKSIMLKGIFKIVKKRFDYCLISSQHPNTNLKKSFYNQMATTKHHDNNLMM